MTTQTQNKKVGGAKVPTLRFPEFSGAWEEKKLGDFLVPTLREVLKPSAPYLALGIRSHFKGTFQKPDSDPANIVMDMLYSVAEGDLILNITFAWEGAVAIAKKEDEGGFVSHRFPTYTFDNDAVVRDFFRFVFPRERMKYDLINVSPGGAGRNRVLNKKDFLKLKTYIPSIKEQQKIADFLEVVDEKIEGLSKKKASLERYKKGVMQKIFSQEIRFKDENGNLYPDWEEKKLGEIGEIVGGGTPDTADASLWNGKINWFTPTEIKQKYVSTSARNISAEGLRSSSAKLLPAGTLLLTTRATIGDVSILKCEATTNQGFQSIIVNKENSNDFIYYWILKNKKEFLRRANGSTFSEISGKEVKKIKAAFPSLLEQKKIADFLTSLDEKISAIGNELSRAKEFKKGLLQQMFM